MLVIVQMALKISGKPRNRRSAEGSFIDMAMTDAKTCMSQCASCLPFTNDDQLQVIQSGKSFF